MKNITKFFLSICFSVIFILPIFAQNEEKNFLKTAENLLLNVKSELDINSEIEFLKNTDISFLKNELNDDIKKKAFWVNIYNAFVLMQLKADESVYEKKNTFFKNKNICIAKIYFSLDDIEHVILRNNTCKWSLGYFKAWFTNKTLKSLMVNELDTRIHFALNCGAASCPPIAYYDFQYLDEEFNIAVLSYFPNGLETDNENIYLPTFMSWFRGDFGGKKGIKNFLIKHQLLKQENFDKKIKFKDYDWTVDLNNFR